MGLLSFLRLKNIFESVTKIYKNNKLPIMAEYKTDDKPILAQLENNRIMAMSAHFFESAWPALIGWTSGLCVTLYYVPQLIIANYLWAKMSIEHNVIYPFPIPADDILNLVYLLFGFGTFHIVKRKILDKVKET